MLDEPTKTVPELLEERESLLQLKEAMEKRLANIHGKEEQREEALSERALNPQCTFDRQHTEMLYTLALFPLST
jgi:hypothetical protein